MNRCPITYRECEGPYSEEGLRLLSPSLKQLREFPYSAAEQVHESAARAAKMSIQGVQPKLSAVLAAREGTFLLVDSGGRYILKPQHPAYPLLPENEDLTMKMAKRAGIGVPLHGMIRCIDGTLTYFVSRFDRRGRNNRVAVEDFAQLSGRTRDTKYDASMESLAKVLDAHCTFPALEKRELFSRTVFCYLTGNEDMHLKSFSLIADEGKVRLSPAYDLLSTTLVLPKDAEEVALSLRGKRRGLKREDWLDYWGRERLELAPRVVDGVLEHLAAALPDLEALIAASFLAPAYTEQYAQLLRSRATVLGLRS